MGLILTPGSKKQFLAKLADLTQYVHDDMDRETIMYWTAGLIQPIVNQFAFYDPKKYPAEKKTTRPHRCGGIIDPSLTKGLLRKKRTL